MRRHVPIFAAFVMLSPAASSETLLDAWNAALDSHLLLDAAREQHEAARLGLDGARADRHPRLDVASGFTRLDGAPRLAFDGFSSPPLFDNDSFLTASAEVSVPLYTGGALRHGVLAAESAADASEWRIGAVTQEIKLAVAIAYIDVLRAESALIVADSNVATLTAHTADAENRYESGAVPRNDYLAASVALAAAGQQRLRAQNALELARAAFNRLLARELTASVDLDPELGVDGLVGDTLDYAGLVSLARERRPELAAAEAAARALREQSDASRGESKPQLALRGGYWHLENEVLDEEGFWTVGIGLQWNLFDSGRSRSRAAVFDRRADALLLERADLEAGIALEIRRALLDRAEAESRRLLAGQAAEQAAENLEVARDRYVSGAGTNADVLDAEALRTESIDNLDNAGFDIDAAELRLARAVGAL